MADNEGRRKFLKLAGVTFAGLALGGGMSALLRPGPGEGGPVVPTRTSERGVTPTRKPVTAAATAEAKATATPQPEATADPNYVKAVEADGTRHRVRRIRLDGRTLPFGVITETIREEVDEEGFGGMTVGGFFGGEFRHLPEGGYEFDFYIPGPDGRFFPIVVDTLTDTMNGGSMNWQADERDPFLITTRFFGGGGGTHPSFGRLIANGGMVRRDVQGVIFLKIAQGVEICAIYDSFRGQAPGALIDRVKGACLDSIETAKRLRAGQAVVARPRVLMWGAIFAGMKIEMK